MANGWGLGAGEACAVHMTRRQAVVAGAVALLAGLGVVGRAVAATGVVAGDARDASSSSDASAASGARAGSSSAGGADGVSGSLQGGKPGSGASTAATSSGKGASTKGASSSKAGAASNGASASAESNKARKFKEIPAEALIGVDELHDLFEAGDVEARKVYVIDIRSHRDYQNQLIEGSRNIPAGRQIEIRMSEIPQDKEVVLIALKNSNRLAETYFTLMANGYDPDLVRVLDGGVKAWVDAGYPTLEDQFLGC